MSLKLATWNINSVRLRIGLVTKLLEGWQPVFESGPAMTDGQIAPRSAIWATRPG